MAQTTYERFSRAQSNVAYVAAIVFTAFILAILALVVGYLLYIGIGSLNWHFFTQVPSGRDRNDIHGDVGGMKNAIVGTVILIGMASAVGVPMGMLTGVYLSEYEAGSWLATPIRFVCDILTGVPSIVVGVLGYELLVVPFGSGMLFGIHLPFLKHLGITGNNGYAGALALAFIMVPIVARTTEEMLRLVPNSYREASIGLGATKAQTIIQVVIPAATGSLVTGVMLAIARVAGETAPLLFTAGGSRLLTTNPAEPFPSLTVQIYNYVGSSSPDLHRQGWAGIIVLIAMIFVLNLSIRYFASRKRA